MALPATDTFTGVNGTALPTYSASWSANIGTLQINTNACEAGAGGTCTARWNADTFPDDQYATGTIVTTGSSNPIGVVVRVSTSGANTCYGFIGASNASSGEFFKLVAGVYTQFGSALTAFSNADVVRVEAVGTTITAKRNGVVQGSPQTDSSIASGAAGVCAVNSTGNRIDNWEGGKFEPDSRIANPVYVATGAQSVTNTSGATLSPALPTGWAVDDFLLLVIAGRCAGSTIANTVSAGWTQRGTGQFLEIGAFDLHVDIWWRIAQIGDAAPTVTPDADFLPGGTTGGASAQIVAYRNVSKAQPFDIATDAQNTAAAAATWTPPQVTTVTPRSLAVTVVATADDNALNFNTANSFTVDAGGANFDTATGSDHAVGVGSVVQVAPGAVTMCIWNQSAVGNDAWVGITTALRAANADLVPLRVMWPVVMMPLMVQ
jgi:hypothetical protein